MTVVKLVRFFNRCHLIPSEAFKPQLAWVMIWGTLLCLWCHSFLL